MTGYFLTPTRVAVSKELTGPFTDLGEICPRIARTARSTRKSAQYFRHPKKRSFYIALADRWMPDLSGRLDFESGVLSDTVRRAIGRATAKPSQPLTAEERTALIASVAIRLTPAITALSDTITVHQMRPR